MKKEREKTEQERPPKEKGAEKKDTEWRREKDQTLKWDTSSGRKPVRRFRYEKHRKEKNAVR